MDLQSILLAITEAVQTVGETTATESGGILGTLGIDFKLFLAQLVNFGVVLFIFWKWVVKPLGKTLTDRQNRIESGLKNADLMESEKRKFDEWKSAEMKKVRSEAEKVLKGASDTAEKIKVETLGTAQTQANKLVEQAMASIESEKVQMLKEVRTELADLVVMASEKILNEKLTDKKDADLIKKSIEGVK